MAEGACVRDEPTGARDEYPGAAAPLKEAGRRPAGRCRLSCGAERAGRVSGARWRLGLLLLLLTLAAAVPAPSLAQEGATFTRSEVMPDFPRQIEFRLEATAGVEITEVRLYYGHIQEPPRTEARPDFTPGRQVTATFTLNTRERYLPLGSEIEYFWAVRDASGARHESARQRFTLTDPRHSWRSQTRGLVTLHWYAGGDDFARDVLETAERTLARLKAQAGVEPTTAINIYLYGSNADFAAALPPNSAEWIGGQAYPALNLIIAGVRPDAGAAREVRRMVPHELSHIVLHQATRNPYNSPPTWLDEGLAVYNQETPDGRFPPLIREAARKNTLIPLRALNASFPLDPNEAILSYAQSGAMVEFVITQFGPEKAAALVAIFREGVSYDEAVQRALGVTLEDLDRQWRASLSGGSAAVGVGAWADPAAGGPAEDGGALAQALFLGLALLASLAVLLAPRLRERRARWL